MQQMAVGGFEWSFFFFFFGWWLGGCREAFRSTNLLLGDVIELYPDLLLGRRRVMMRDEGGR